MAEETDAIRELADDHRQLEEIFRRLESTPSTDRSRRAYTDQATIELVRHYVAEEEFLYPALHDRPVPSDDPALRDRLAEGADPAKAGIEEHARAEQVMRLLEDADADSADFDRLLDRLVREVREQTREEEDLLFPYVRAALPLPVLVDLGFRIRRVKSIVPTRPYPAAPGVPPTSRLLYSGPGLVDRVRAVLSGWSHSF
jgi:hypothetical protein